MSAPNVRSALLDLLNDSSAPYRDPLARLNWETVDTATWWLPPHALSLAGVPEFDSLSLLRRRALSQWEFVHFIETALWLDSLFIRRLGAALDATTEHQHRSRFLHEIREQAGHGLMFLELIARSGIRIERGSRHRPQLMRLLLHGTADSSPLFWALVIVGEELPDKLSRAVRSATGEAMVSPLLHQMTTLHIVDQARHIAHARAAFEQAMRRQPRWRRAVLSPLLSSAIDAFVNHLFIPPAAIYSAARLPASVPWRQRAQDNPRRREWIAQAIKPTFEFLRTQGWHITSRYG